MSNLLQLHGYTMMNKIGRGGFGTVYRATAPDGSIVAVKVLNPELAGDPALAGSFLEEGRRLALLGSLPNVIRCRDVFARNDEIAFVMDYIDGGDLAAYLRAQGGTLAPAEAFELAALVCDGLQGIHHSAGLAHRDIKPANILLQRSPAGGVVPMIADFGIASVVGKHSAAGRSLSTGAGMNIAGTLPYVSPESLGEAAGRSADHRPGDLYAVGCVLYELLCGSPPFPMANVIAVLEAHRRYRPVPIDGLPDKAWTVIAQLLHKRPIPPRPTDAADAATKLRAAIPTLKGLVPLPEAQPHPVAPDVDTDEIGVPVLPAPKRWGLRVAAAAAVVALLAGGGFIYNRSNTLIPPAGASALGLADLAPEVYPDGLMLKRRWEITGTDRPVLSATTTIENPTTRTLDATVQDVIPASMTKSAADVTFTPQPDIVQSDLQFTYKIAGLTAGQTKTLLWTVRIPKSAEAPQTRLKAWIGDRGAALAAHPSSIAVPVTLTSITLTLPDTLASGAATNATVGGSMSDSTSAAPKLTEDYKLVADNDTVTITGHKIVAVHPGTTTIVATLAGLESNPVTVTVLNMSGATDPAATTTVDPGVKGGGVLENPAGPNVNPPGDATPAPAKTVDTPTSAATATDATTDATSATTIETPTTRPTTATTASTAATPVAPSTMAAPGATAGDSAATVTFTAPEPGTATMVRYDILGSDGVTRTASGSGQAFTGLANGTAYTFQTRACSSAGCGAWSAASGSVVPAGTPGVPSGLSQTDNSLTAIRVGWNAANGNGGTISGYQLLIDGGTVVSVGNTTTWVHGGLGNSESHSYAIRTVTNAATSGWSGTVTGRTQDPPAPTTYAETVGGAANTWTNYTNAGGSQGATIAKFATVQITCRVTGFKVTDGNTWWYRIASSPWNNTFYVSADVFYNNGATSGSLIGTPWYDTKVPVC